MNQIDPSQPTITYYAKVNCNHTTFESIARSNRGYHHDLSLVSQYSPEDLAQKLLDNGFDPTIQVENIKVLRNAPPDGWKGDGTYSLRPLTEDENSRLLRALEEFED